MRKPAYINFLLTCLVAFALAGLSSCASLQEPEQMSQQISDATEAYILYADTADQQRVRATRIIAFANAYQKVVDELVVDDGVKLNAEVLAKAGEEVLDRFYPLPEVERNRALFVIRKVAEFVAPRIKGIPVPEDQLALLSQAVADIKRMAERYQ